MKEKTEENRRDYLTKRGSAHGRVLLCWTAVLFSTSTVSRSRRLLACIIGVYIRTKSKHIIAPCLSSLKRIYMNPKKKTVDQIDHLSSHKKDAGNDDLRRTVRQNMIAWEIKTVNLSIFQGYPARITPSQKCLVDRDKLDIKLESGAMIGLAIFSPENFWTNIITSWGYQESSGYRKPKGRESIKSLVSLPT